MAASILIALAWPPLFAMPLFTGQLGALLSVVICLPLMMALEAASMALVGTTLGKWAAGVKISKVDDERIGGMLALRRGWMVYVRGLALGVFPLYGLTYWLNFKRLERGKATSWDDRLGTRVDDRGASTARTIAVAVLTLVLRLPLILLQAAQA